MCHVGQQIRDVDATRVVMVQPVSTTVGVVPDVCVRWASKVPSAHVRRVL